MKTEMETDQPTKFRSPGPEAKSKQNSLSVVVPGKSIRLKRLKQF